MPTMTDSKQGSLGQQVYESFFDFFSGLYTEVAPKPHANGTCGLRDTDGQGFASPRMGPQDPRLGHQGIVRGERSPNMNGQGPGLDPRARARDPATWRESEMPTNGDVPPAHGISNANGSAAMGGGMSSTAPAGQPYVADKEDLLDQHVAYYLRHHPEVHQRNHFIRKRPGVYELNNREVLVEWQYATEPGAQGYLVVLDGPLRQPFSDYMENNEANAEYDNHSLAARSSLHQIPKEKRMSFGDQNKVYTRLEAMKVAKEQAVIRETAADYIKDGRMAPDDLMSKYKKTIAQKLGPNRRTAPQPQGSGGPPGGSPGPGPDVPSPAAVPPPQPQPPPQVAAPPPPPPQAQPVAPQAASQPYGQPSYGPPAGQAPWNSYGGPPLNNAAVAQPCAAQAWGNTPSLTPPQGLFHGGHATLAPSAQPPAAAYQMQSNAAVPYARWG